MSSKKRNHDAIQNQNQIEDQNQNQIQNKSSILKLINCQVLHPSNASFYQASIEINTTTGKIVSITTPQEENNTKQEIIHGNQETDNHNNENENDDDDEKESKLQLYDCKNQRVSPGFIDIQLNGAYGVDFSNSNICQEDVSRVAAELPKTGVTTFCPTIISSCPDTYRRVISVIGPMCQDLCHHEKTKTKTKMKPRGAKMAGIHLEGPYFAFQRKGAHSAQHIQTQITSPSSLEQTYGLPPSQLKQNGVSIVTLAPELPGAFTTITDLVSKHVVVAMGHTNATLAQGIEGVKRGCTLLTHLYNAMNPFHHREPGLLGLLVHNDEEEPETEKGLWYSLIVDGLHSHPAAVRMAYRLNPSGMVLITDAMSAMGLGDGKHTLGSMAVDIHGVRATVEGTDTLAGSVVSMDRCVRSLCEFTGCDAGEALRAASLHPARVLGCEDVTGWIGVGCDADLVLLDERLGVVATWVKGTLCYHR